VPGYAVGRSTGPGTTAPGGSSQSHAGAGSSAGLTKKNPIAGRAGHNLTDVGGAPFIGSGAGLWLPVGIPFLVVLLIGTPALTRKLTRRRRWLTASGDAAAADAAWHELTDDLADLAMPCNPGDTPRAVAVRVSSRTGFDPAAAAALTRIVDAEERARYARQPAPGAGLAADVRVVRRAVAATASRKRRLRATLLPASTLAAARRLLERASGLLGWLDTSWPTVRRQMGRAG
jgi:hypothetical protein